MGGFVGKSTTNGSRKRDIQASKLVWAVTQVGKVLSIFMFLEKYYNDIDKKHNNLMVMLVGMENYNVKKSLIDQGS